MPYKTVPRLVVTDEDWEMLRLIRNTCIDGFTGHREEISRDAQREYKNAMRQNPFVRHYIYSHLGVDVGFSRLEWKNGFINPTMGVASWARGNGFARDIVKQLLLAAGGPLKGTLLASNTAICKVDYSLGFVKDGPAVQGLQNIKCDWPPPMEIWE